MQTVMNGGAQQILCIHGFGKTAEEAKLPSSERTEKSDEIQRKYETLVSETEIKTRTLKERFFR